MQALLSELIAQRDKVAGMRSLRVERDRVAGSRDLQLTLTFSSPVRDALGARRPRLSPVTPGRWRQPDAHTLTFEPTGLGFGLGGGICGGGPRLAL